MRVLADTNVFVQFVKRLPLDEVVESTLANPQTERLLSAVSVIEIYRKWQGGAIPDDPDNWLELALEGWSIIPIDFGVARQSVLWPWPHKDPADRLIAATALVEQVELWHTDTVLRRLRDFPQRYFVNRLQR